MKENCKIKEMTESERPYEKCSCYGAAALSDAELLAVLMRTGTKGMNALELARNLLKTANGEESLLNVHHLTRQRLERIKGIGKVKAIQILCLSELAKRLAKTSAKEGLTFRDPSAVAEYYMEELRHQKQEQMKLLMLNTKAKLLGESNISKGTVNASLITPRELFIEALERGAVAIVLIHNHPSGVPTPSQNDIMLTKRVKEAGELIGIELLDHIIIGNNCYVSLAEEKLI
ncbi:MAG: DNA repair protein RadC [Faecalimonas sp.]|nr:DNA repair protein RadC [Faecalimonas sp.]